MLSTGVNITIILIDTTMLEYQPTLKIDLSTLLNVEDTTMLRDQLTLTILVHAILIDTTMLEYQPTLKIDSSMLLNAEDTTMLVDQPTLTILVHAILIDTPMLEYQSTLKIDSCIILNAEDTTMLRDQPVLKIDSSMLLNAEGTTMLRYRPTLTILERITHVGTIMMDIQSKHQLTLAAYLDANLIPTFGLKIIIRSIEVGHVELQKLGKGIFFGNFIGTNRDGKIYAVILNETAKELKITPLEVRL